MKKIYLFSFLGLAFMPVIQQNTSYQYFVINTQLTSRGGGVKMNNAGNRASPGSLESISGELAKLGITVQFVSKNSPISTEENKNDPTLKSCVYLSKPEENVKPKFVFQKPGNYKSTFNAFDPSGINQEFYNAILKSLIWYYNFMNADDESSLIKLNMAERLAKYGRHPYVHGSILPKIEKNIERKEQGDICAGSAYDCTADPSDFIYTENQIRKTPKIYYGKNHTMDISGFFDVSYENDGIDMLADDYDDGDNLLCEVGNTCKYIADACYYFAYYPYIDYSECGLPVVFLFHAGGFSGCSQLNYEDALCRMIARKGFIVINVEYRRGRIKDNGTNYTSVQQQLAIYRAMQDGRGALRTAIDDVLNRATNGLPYNFDTSEMYVAGQSAGGIIAGSLAYYTTQSQIDSIFPSPAGLYTISDELGPIDADFYRGDITINFHSGIKALWCMWGAFGIPMPVSLAGDEYNFLSINGTVPLVPMIAFMGNKDLVFPPTKSDQYVYFPPEHGHETYIMDDCVYIPSYKIYSSDGSQKQLRMECTKNLYKILKANGIATIIYIDCKMGHGLEKPKLSTDPITTNFGITTINPTYLNDVNNYLASRFAFFARAIYRGDANHLNGTSKFSSCEDFRKDCNRLESNDGCSNSQNCKDNSFDDE